MTAAVIGVGNEFRHDDGLGAEVVRRLAGRDLPDVRLAVSDGEPARLIELWSDADVAVLVDAVRNDPAHPGKLHEFVVDLPTGGPQGTASSHGLGLGEAIDLALALDRMPRRMVILAVEGADFSPGVGLSPQVTEVVDRLVDLVVHEVAGPARWRPGEAE